MTVITFLGVSEGLPAKYVNWYKFILQYHLFCEISWLWSLLKLMTGIKSKSRFLIDCICRMVFIFAFIAKLCDALEHTCLLWGLFLVSCLFHDSACVDVALTFPRHATLGSLVNFSSVSIAVLACSRMGYDFHSFDSGEQGVRWHCNVSVI